jgi:hypothetical protein
VRVLEARLERGQVRLHQVLHANDGVVAVALVAVPVLDIVPGVVLAVGDDLVVLGILSLLVAADQVVHVLGRQVRVLPHTGRADGDRGEWGAEKTTSAHVE